MAIIQGIIFKNRQAFNGKQGAVYNYYLSKNKGVDRTVIKRWSDGIDALDGSGEVLMLVDERISGFPWSPEQIVDIDTNDPKWFNNNSNV